ncbi:hypothetical protein LTR37_007599 [Vermiconidia calcicola]|uniref:Uncharacterized protein n=1 Tax=Vermiconidia calcicola TaxID=1690605 RepID=A0ACC3NDS5_9PEZI|nr:hypothetical protein LTR37_007599 [Vermiconidia calcicola]
MKGRQVTMGLVDQFFCKAQNFLPLFHRPRFYERYVSKAQNDADYDAMALDAALILNGVLALAARYSTSPYFSGAEPACRGDPFGRKAKEIYDASVSRLETPSLPFLQGCVLLGFYLLSSGSGIQGWLVCGTCSRIAYEMGLDTLDQQPASSSGGQTATDRAWTIKEELRRAWWCVWELEVVASTIYRRPHTVPKVRAQVMLPVSDEAWWADEEVPSAIIPASPLRAWQALRDCANQSERAWFLVGNYLIYCAHDMLQQSQYTPQDIQEIETAITGFTQLLPVQFRASSGIVFDTKCFGKANWIVSTLLMLQGSRIYVKLLKQCEASDPCADHHNGFLASLPTPVPYEPALLDFSCCAQGIMDIVHEWPPEFIGMNTPFIATLLLGPAKINLRVLQHRESIDFRKGVASSVASSQKAILKLAVEKVARYWKFGSILLDEFRLSDP